MGELPKVQTQPAVVSLRDPLSLGRSEVFMNSELEHAVTQLRSACGGFNDPANDAALRRLEEILGRLPIDVLDLYRNHDGNNPRPEAAELSTPTRLLPVDEAIETNAECAEALEAFPKLGSVVLLWYDDNSNYLGLYTSGLLQGWLTTLNHEEPILVPAYSSVGAFYRRLAASIPGLAPESSAATDLPSVPREYPRLADDPLWIARDRELANALSHLYQAESDEDKRRLYAMSSICLTPVVDTKAVLSFFHDDDMWTPEAAVKLLEFRRVREGVEELEQLAQEGYPNGDSAAMRCLVRMNSNASQNSVTRLKAKLTGQKLQMLNQWLRYRDGLQPPRWP